MKQEGEVKYCNIARDIFIKHFEQNYSYIKEKLPLLEVLDPDAIHDIRVTSRRNRALFTEFKYFLPEEIRKEYVFENRNITRLLGKRRELDVLYQYIEKDIQKIFPELWCKPLLKFIDKKRKKESKNCFLSKKILENRINKLTSNIYNQIPQNKCIYTYGRKRIFTSLEEIQGEYKKIKNIEDPFNEEIHKFRILLKKTRYMFEIYKEIYKNPLDKWIQVLKEIQNHLGLWNDYRILLITIKKKYKEEKNISYSNFLIMYNYICDIIIKKLGKVKETVDENISVHFIKMTTKDVDDIYKSHRVFCEIIK